MLKTCRKYYRWIKLVKLTRKEVLVARNTFPIAENEARKVDPDLVEIRWDSGGCADPTPREHRVLKKKPKAIGQVSFLSISGVY